MIMGHEDVSVLFKLHRIKERVGKDIFRGYLNPDTSGTDDESRNDDAPKEDMALKESLESASCDDDVEKGDTLKRS